MLLVRWEKLARMVAWGPQVHQGHEEEWERGGPWPLVPYLQGLLLVPEGH